MNKEVEESIKLLIKEANGTLLSSIIVSTIYLLLMVYVYAFKLDFTESYVLVRFVIALCVLYKAVNAKLVMENTLTNNNFLEIQFVLNIINFINYLLVGLIIVDIFILK